jgi:hypothetical protein
MGFAVAALLLLALVVLCVAGYLVIRVLMPDSPPVVLPSFITQTPSATPAGGATQPPASPSVPPTPGEVVVTINPERGYINTLITVTGEGWWPGEPVFVFLRSHEEGDGRGYAYAAAVADDNGGIRTALTFPNEIRWIGQQWADVIARGNRSGLEASSRFTFVVPTPTPTPVPPTPRPTRLPTDTPAPTETPAPTDTPMPTATPTPELVITDWRGEYFANATVSGDPVLVRNDAFVDFNWGGGSPGGGLPVDGFSARWTRFLAFDEGRYRFDIVADDGVRLWVDGKLVVDEWHDSVPETYSAEVQLSKGSHALQIEYYENLGGALIQVKWRRAEATPTPEPTATVAPDAWRGEYFDNMKLEGQPVFVRQDADVDFDWGRGSPGEGVSANGFSVRWTTSPWVPAGTYRVYVQANEGVRYWLDGVLLIDEWHKSTGETYMVEVFVPAGVHTVKVEYYEGAGDAHIHLWGETVP